MDTSSAGYRYFHPKHGHWRGAYRFSVLSLRALLSSEMRWFGKLSALSMSLFCRIFGAFQIRTEVDTTNALSAGDVLHKTWISKWGVLLFESEEHFLFGEDGKTLRVKGWQRMMPLWWWKQDYGDSHGEINEDGEHASYMFRWFGAKMKQRSIPKPEGLFFAQELEGCEASFVLNKN
jgi:hypothetical protein